ncbi:MAG TPA: trypsin-like serine protease [Labilithrix sp.]|nr:trypsin-like serine protease [Labilithrix sp.]
MSDISLRRSLVVVGVLLVAGCAEVADDTGASQSPVIAGMQDGAPTDLPEVVQVMVDNKPRDFCTGTLISPTRVITAAHCMGGTSFEVIAPNAGQPYGVVQSSKAWQAGSVTRSNNYNEEVEKEDVAFLDLDTPIRSATYATLEDVGELGAQTLRAVAVGRTEAERKAPLVKSKELTVRSATERGYTTGLMSQYYSSGGDSGGPLFRVDPNTGKPTHVVIGIERQPEPPNEFFSRITPAVSRLATKPHTIAAGSCAVAGDKKLHCANRGNTPILQAPNATSAVVDTLRTTYSSFDCWVSGEAHTGGNSTWYLVQGDDKGVRGYVPGSALHTHDAFDLDPNAYGLVKCAD